MPGQVMTSGGTWLDHERGRIASRGREFRSRQASTIAADESVTGSAWAEITAHLRPSSSSSQASAAGGGGGGRLGGTAVIRPQSSAEYDMSKHGWYHPYGQAEQLKLREQSQPGSWGWTMLKARDHIGYGVDGIVDHRDSQVTAITRDAPDWFVGTRRVAGPLHTKSVPVERCPMVEVEGKEVKVRAKTYARGDGLCTLETLHDRSTPPTPVPTIRIPRHHDQTPTGKKTAFVNRISQFRDPGLPINTHVTYDGASPAPPMVTQKVLKA